MGKYKAKSKLNNTLLIVLVLLVIVTGLLFSNYILNVEKDKKVYNVIKAENTASSVAVEATLKKDIFEDYYEKARNLLKNMTLEEKVGQMFLARYPENGVIDEIKTRKPRRIYII